MTKRRINQRKKDHYFVLFLATVAGMTAISVAYTQHTVPLDLLETPLAHAETSNESKEYTKDEVKRIVQVVAEQEGISDRLMHYVAENESHYNLEAVNHTDPRGGAIGLYQIILGFHPSVTVECAKDPWCSARYFAKRVKGGDCKLWTTCRNYYAQ